MSQISFSTKPQKKYYSYNESGSIYNITSLKPTEIGDGGGIWYCYFEVNPYHKVDDKVYPLCIKETVDDKTEYIKVTTNTFNNGQDYYYSVDDKSYKKHTGKYFDKTGKNEYNMPNTATELPQIPYDEKVYYLDTLIKTGGTYVSGKFMPLDTDGKDSKTTFGDVLLKMVDDNVKLDQFKGGVKNLPEYLTGATVGDEYKVESIGYIVPKNYFVIYGGLFMKKLTAQLKSNAEVIINKYAKTEITTEFVKAEVETEVKEGAGIVTITPKKKS